MTINQTKAIIKAMTDESYVTDMEVFYDYMLEKLTVNDVIEAVQIVFKTRIQNRIGLIVEKKDDKP